MSIPIEPAPRSMLVSGVLVLLALGAAAPAQASGQVSVDGLTVGYPDGWMVEESTPKASRLFKLPPGASALPTDPAELADLPLLSVSAERRLSHAGAVRRLRDLSGAPGVTAEALVIDGWPAVQVEYVTARAQSSQGDAVGSETVLVVRTAVAVDRTLLRLEAWLPPDADAALVAEVRAIGTGLQFESVGDAGEVEQELRRLEESIESRPSSTLEALQSVAGGEGGGAAPLEAAPEAAGGAVVPVANAGNNPHAELEIAVSANGKDIVIGSNNQWFYSPDGGQMWNPAPVFGNDPSLGWGQSGGAQGTFYGANISIPAMGSGFTSIQVSTDGGNNWMNATPAYTCGQNGDAQCATSSGGTRFPDQEHIAVDRWNVAAGGDQVYSAWRHSLAGGWSIVCSADSANTWTPNRYISGPGDIPRITVGQDGFVYVVYYDPPNIMLDKFAPCETQGNPMTNVAGFPVTVRRNVVNVVCPMPGLNRCNDGNRLLSPTVAVDDTDANHVYVAYANNTNPGTGANCPAPPGENLCNDDVIVQDSFDGGLSWPGGDPTDFCFGGLFCFNSGAGCSSNTDCFDPDRTVKVSSGITARRFMPWVCSVGGDAYVTWFDRRAAFPGGTTISNNSLTDFFGGRASLDALGALETGPEFQLNEPGTSDPQCEAGFPMGSFRSWPNGTRATSDSDSCSVQPQPAGFCCVPADVSGGFCRPTAASSGNRCDFDTTVGVGTPPCLAGESCTVALGTPKYGDYNGNTCGVGRVFATWSSSVAPAGQPAPTGVDSFFSSKIVCCVPQIQVPGSVHFGSVCGSDTQTAELEVCNTGKEDLEVSSITSDDDQFAVTTPSSGFPVIISPDFCFPFEATFTPDDLGAASATLTINNNDPVNPSVAVMASGSVGEPDINLAIANSGSFGEVCAGDHADLDLTLFNQGECNLTISDIDITPPFQLPDDLQLPLVLSPDADFRFPIRYEPDECFFGKPEEGTVEITSDDPDEMMLSVDLSGRSPCPDLVIDPGSLEELFAFPTTVVDTAGTLGCYSERTAVVRNVGACPATISDISATGADFTVTAPTQFPILLPPGEETLSVAVRFTPAGDANPLAPSEVTGLLTVASDDPNGPEQADLCGESSAQSGVRVLVTEVSSGTPTPVAEVDALTISSKGKGPKTNLRFTDHPVSMATVCGNPVVWHVDQETLSATETTGSNPRSSYEAKAKEGNLQVTESFGLDQCELREFQLQLQDNDSGVCLLLPKGSPCANAGECCSGKCKGPEGSKTCK